MGLLVPSQGVLVAEKWGILRTVWGLRSRAYFDESPCDCKSEAENRTLVSWIMEHVATAEVHPVIKDSKGLDAPWASE